jgi:hypothetical protein
MKISLSLLSNASASGQPVYINESGTYQYSVVGTFGGTTAKLQFLGADGTTYVDVPNSSMTLAGALNVDLPSGSTVKAVLTAGAPSAMYATLNFIRGG